VVNCVPQNCAAAWAVFHFSGMFGTSEAFAESIGGTLKRFSKSLSTARCVESIILRSAGLTGSGGGGEDGFLELCWADFLGSRQKLSFHYRNSKKRRKLYVMGQGSATLNRLLTDKKLQRNMWTERDLLKAAQVLGAGTGPTKTWHWRKAVKKARTSEAG